jgi:ribosomal protein S28E/S33
MARWPKKPDDDNSGGKPMDAQPVQAMTEVVNIDGVSEVDVKKLMSEVQELREKLAKAEEGRSEAEKQALELAKSQAGMVIQSVVQEVPTGKTVEVQRAKRYEVVGYKDDGRPIHKTVMGPVKLPTFFYRIDLPPIGGEGIQINGVPLLHGMTVELDIDTLRTVKDIVHRIWKHDANVHGENENAYRSMSNRSFNTGRVVNI